MRTPFNERAGDMGLEYDNSKGFYKYSDRYSEVIYRQLSTMFSSTQENPTDNFILPALGIFTKSETQEDYNFCGILSDYYQFMGNDVLNQNIRESIQQVGLPIVTENTIQSLNLTKMRTEMIIQSSQEVANVGDVLPVIITNNSYDGSKAATVSFGIATNVSSERVIFGFKLGQMKQIHLVNSNTEMASSISSYMQVFSESITDMISSNFNKTLTIDEMFGVMDLIEKYGKKRREEISEFLAKMNPPAVEGEDPPLPSAWMMFLAIVRYSSFEPNLNMKSLLENAAESVLVIPERMYNVLEKLEE